MHNWRYTIDHCFSYVATMLKTKNGTEITQQIMPGRAFTSSSVSKAAYRERKVSRRMATYHASQISLRVGLKFKFRHSCNISFQVVLELLKAHYDHEELADKPDADRVE